MVMAGTNERTPGIGERMQGARYFGKYRGRVTRTDDNKGLGRIKAMVPEVLRDVESSWALPSVPYAGDNRGAFVIPAPGTGVWIEFEAGKVWRPIWTGCFWGENQAPKDEQGSRATPDVKILRSEKGLLVALDDSRSSITISDENARNKVVVEVTAGKVTVQAGTKVVVEAPAIELVRNAAHPIVFGDDLLQYLNQVVQIFNTHVHTTELLFGIFPVTPAPPVAQLMPPSPTMLSLKVKSN